MLAVHLVTVSLLAAAWTAAEVGVEESNYASRFYRWFSGSSKSCLLFLVAPPDLIDTLAQLLALRSLLRLSMTWRWKYLTEGNFLSTTTVLQSLLHKVAGPQDCNFFKMRLQHRRFFVKFVEFLRTLFLQHTSGGCFINSTIHKIFR